MRLLALEFLVSIVEASPAMCRKIGDGTVAIQSGMRVGNSPTPIPVEKTPVDDSSTFAATVIPVCFSMMTELQQVRAYPDGFGRYFSQELLNIVRHGSGERLLFSQVGIKQGHWDACCGLVLARFSTIACSAGDIFRFAPQVIVVGR